MDLANQLQSKYFIHRTAHTQIPQPRLSGVPSLYDISLQCFMPQFMQTCSPNKIPPAFYPDLLKLIPDDTNLSTIF